MGALVVFICFSDVFCEELPAGGYPDLNLVPKGKGRIDLLFVSSLGSLSPHVYRWLNFLCLEFAVVQVQLQNPPCLELAALDSEAQNNFLVEKVISIPLLRRC